MEIPSVLHLKGNIMSNARSRAFFAALRAKKVVIVYWSVACVNCNDEGWCFDYPYGQCTGGITYYDVTKRSECPQGFLRWMYKGLSRAQRRNGVSYGWYLKDLV